MKKGTQNSDKKEEKPKVSDQQIIEAYRENYGIVSRAARWLEKKHGIRYSHVSFKNRIEKMQKEGSELIAERDDNLLDLAEEVLLTILMKGTEKGQLKAVEIILKSKGRARGWFVNESAETPTKIQIEILDRE